MPDSVLLLGAHPKYTGPIPYTLQRAEPVRPLLSGFKGASSAFSGTLYAHWQTSHDAVRLCCHWPLLLLDGFLRLRLLLRRSQPKLHCFAAVALYFPSSVERRLMSIYRLSFFLYSGMWGCVQPDSRFCLKNSGICGQKCPKGGEAFTP